MRVSGSHFRSLEKRVAGQPQPVVSWTPSDLFFIEILVCMLRLGDTCLV